MLETREAMCDGPHTRTHMNKHTAHKLCTIENIIFLRDVVV